MAEGRRSVLEGVPRSLPTLVKTVRMQEKTAGVGFEYASADDALAKVREEYGELQAALAGKDETDPQPSPEVVEEFGDLLFALVKWGGMLGINADDALARANRKFKHRFAHVEEAARNKQTSISDLPAAELLALWQQAKRQED
jgi:XTP/dITP diphosphohydrolase